MTAPALVISPRDNVATALEPLEAGRVLDIGGERITSSRPSRAATRSRCALIRAGEAVLKYGSPIGTATVDIPAGAHVHTHNVASRRGRGDLQREQGAEAPRIAEPPDRSPVTGQRRMTLAPALPWLPQARRARRNTKPRPRRADGHLRVRGGRAHRQRRRAASARRFRIWQVADSSGRIAA